MNKYKRKFKIVEKIPAQINSIGLKILLLKFKLKRYMEYDFIKFKDLGNSLCFNLLFNKLHMYSDREISYIKKHILSKIDENEIYRFYIQHISNALCLKDYNEIINSLQSFVVTGLIKDARLVTEEKDKIELILPSEEKVIFSNALSSPSLAADLRGNCHSITSLFLNPNIIGESSDTELAVVLEKNALCGRAYHSFIISNNTVKDYAHNIEINYDNYIKLVNPIVLVKEKSQKVKEEIEMLRKEKQFSSCNYSEILKYGISKQLVKVKKPR